MQCHSEEFIQTAGKYAFTKQTNVPNKRHKGFMSLNTGLGRAQDEKQMLSGRLEQPARGKWIPGLKTKPEVGDIECPHTGVDALRSPNSCTKPVTRYLGIPPVPKSKDSGIVKDAFLKRPPVLQISVRAQPTPEEHQASAALTSGSPSRVSTLTEMSCANLRTFTDTSVLCFP